MTVNMDLSPALVCMVIIFVLTIMVSVKMIDRGPTVVVMTKIDTTKIFIVLFISAGVKMAVIMMESLQR